VIEALSAELDRLALRGETIGYGELARRLEIPGPGSIAQLTVGLERLMAGDHAQGRPLRAVLCTGRITGGLPARGFFEAAARLGRYAGPPEGGEAMAFAAAERAAVFGMARDRGVFTS
jgi:hypothetical protein